jgi:hypothetical protein
MSTASGALIQASIVKELSESKNFDELLIYTYKDTELKAILEHNRDEEKEHASMVLEWIRRKDPLFSRKLKDYLFTEKPIAHQ